MASSETFDLLGVGALNIDYIVKSRWRSIGSEDELPILERDAFTASLAEVRPSVSNTFVGGSAFNTVHAVASLRRDIKLGFVGVAGLEREGIRDIKATFEELGVDHTLVKHYKELAGGCIASVDEDGKRRLRTYAGANLNFPTFLREEKDRILKRLVNTRIVHLSSLFDANSASLIATLLLQAKRKSPMLRVSFDPGDYWIGHNLKNITPILAITDFLFLNQAELKELGGPHRSARHAAVAVFARCNNRTVVVVVKERKGISLFYKSGTRTRAIWHKNDHEVPAISIRDPTGAGDILAGGVLTGILLPGLGIHTGIELGLRMVRHKLQHLGSSCFATFPMLMDTLQDEGDRVWNAANTIVKPRSASRDQVTKVARSKPQMGARQNIVSVFYSYSHQDESLRQKLDTNLKLLQRQGLISTWHDRKITAGEEWKGQIDENLTRARIVLLLVSANFIASDYCYDKEMTFALQQQKKGKAMVIPVILRDVDWHTTPFGKLQALPRDGRPVTRWPDKDSAWKDVAIGVRAVAEKLSKRNR